MPQRQPGWQMYGPPEEQYPEWLLYYAWCYVIANFLDAVDEWSQPYTHLRELTGRRS